MAAFRALSFREILRRMAWRVVARSPITDLTEGSVYLQLLGAVARRIEQAYIEIARLLELYSIDRAEGADLDERAAEYLPDGLGRKSASFATGEVQWSRATADPTKVTIPKGTVVARKGTNPAVQYVTTVDGKIAAGQTTSTRDDGNPGDIPARAEVPGADGNADTGSVTRQVTYIAGTTSVTNPVPFDGGTDEEGDDEFRARIRDHVRSLSRCTPTALETRAREAETDDGRRIRQAKVVENPYDRGLVTLYVDDGTGRPGAWVDLNSDETIIASAEGGERYLFLDHRPVRGSGWKVYHTPNGGAESQLTVDDDYKLVAPWGMIALSDSKFPGGLGNGDKLRIEAYSYWTGLIAQAQRLVDGDPGDPDVDGWRAAGVVVRVEQPTIRLAVIEAVIDVLDGFNRESVRLDVRQAISDYVNSLGIGEPIVLAELYERAMAVEGMYDIRFARPTSNFFVGDGEVARLTSSNNTVE